MSPSTLVPGHKGAHWMRLTAKGRAAHGSAPELGDNAVVGSHERPSRRIAVRPVDQMTNTIVDIVAVLSTSSQSSSSWAGSRARR